MLFYNMNILFSQPYYQNEVSLNSTGLVHQLIGDVHYNNSQNVYRSVHKTNSGMSVFEYDGSSGYPISTIELYRSTGFVQFFPIKIVDLGSTTYILFYFNFSGDKYGIVSYDNVTLSLNWVNRLSVVNSSYVPTDMSIDNINGDVYVSGTHYDPLINESDVFVSRFNSNGTLLWQNRYPIVGRDEFDASIFFHSTNEIYISTVSNSQSTAINKIAYIFRVNLLGSVLDVTNINYDLYNNCNYYRMKYCCAKRFNDEIFVFIPSAIGPDGEGCFSISKLDTNMNLLSYRFYSPANTAPFTSHYYRDFEFTDNGNNISIISWRSQAVSNTQGYGIYNINASSLSNGGGFAYIQTNSAFSMNGPASMRHTYNPNTNNLMLLADNAINSSTFHQIYANYKGRIYTSDCQINEDTDLCDCKYVVQSGSLASVSQSVTFSMFNNFFINNINYLYSQSCVSADCPDCESRNVYINKEELIYPNPNSGEFIYSLQSQNNYSVSFSIIDLSGRIVHTQQINLVEGQNQISFNVEFLPSGIYFLKVDGHDEVNKIVINK